MRLAVALLVLPALAGPAWAGNLLTELLVPPTCGQFSMAGSAVEGRRVAFEFRGEALAIEDLRLDGLPLLREARVLPALPSDAEVGGERFRARAHQGDMDLEVEARDCADAFMVHRADTQVRVAYALVPGTVPLPWSEDALLLLVGPRLAAVTLYEGASFAKVSPLQVVVSLPPGAEAHFCHLDPVLDFECPSGPILLPF